MGVGIRTSLAILSVKVSRGILRFLGRGGTALPGKIAMKIKPDVLAYASAGVETIVVTGTNGKTSTANMIESALTEDGKDVLANKAGANLLSGVTSEFCAACSVGGTPFKKYAVIECDEGALKHVVPLVKPKAIVITNLFRDQLDRYGEIMNVLNAIREAVLKVPESILCLNADESLTASISRDVPNKVYFYGMNIPVGDQNKRETSDASHCVCCGAEYEYDYYTYAHLGGFVCPQCGYKRPETNVSVISIDEMTADDSTVTMEIEGIQKCVHISLPATYNIYNAAAAITAIVALGGSVEGMIATLSRVKSAFGRMETFVLGNKKVRMILVKNPAGGNQTLEYLSTINEEYMLVAALNDKIADGTDVSWIWDMEYERLADIPHIKRVVITGDRRDDLAVRLKYAGIADFEVESDYKEILNTIKEYDKPVFIIPNYTTMLVLRDILKKETGGKDIWEKQ